MCVLLTANRRMGLVLAKFSNIGLCEPVVGTGSSPAHFNLTHFRAMFENLMTAMLMSNCRR